jgi:hypothetical protein
MDAEVTIESGELVAQRVFDVAYAIDLGRADHCWKERGFVAGTRARLSNAPPKALAFDVAPLLVELDPVTLGLDDGEHSARVTARLYDFGVIALCVRLPVVQLRWSQFSARFDSLDRRVGPNGSDDALWNRLLDRVRAAVLPALDRPAASTLQEDYLLGVAHRLDRPRTADELRASVDLVALLSGEQRRLSDAAARELLQRSYSYFADDLIAMSWDRAFIYEPRGDSDVADILEVANAQLVEFRYYDDLLDDELETMRARINQARQAVSLLASRRFANLARKLYTLVAEVTELTGKVDNALKVTEDVYLARVYSAALELFRVPNVSAAVDRKLATIRDTYAALFDEASSRRAEVLEIVIIVLIFVEIVLALFGH